MLDRPGSMRLIAFMEACCSTNDRFSDTISWAKSVSRISEFAAARFCTPVWMPASDDPTAYFWKDPIVARAGETSVIALRITCWAIEMSPLARFSDPPARRSASV